MERNVEQINLLKRRASVSWRRVTLALTLVLLPVAVFLWPGARPQYTGNPHGWPTGKAQIKTRFDHLQQATWTAIKAHDAPLAEKRYAHYIAMQGWDGDVSVAIAKMRIEDGRFEDARTAYRAALYPPSEWSGGVERNSQPWREYAKLCDQMGLAQEAQEARDKAAALHAAEQARAAR